MASFSSAHTIPATPACHDGDEATFDYTAKSGKRRIQVVRDPDLMPILRTLKERRTGRELLAYRLDERWRDLRSGEINDYLKLFFPRISSAYCPSCQREIRTETPGSVVE